VCGSLTDGILTEGTKCAIINGYDFLYIGTSDEDGGLDTDLPNIEVNDSMIT